MPVCSFKVKDLSLQMFLLLILVLKIFLSEVNYEQTPLCVCQCRQTPLSCIHYAYVHLLQACISPPFTLLVVLKCPSVAVSHSRSSYIQHKAVYI